MCRCRRGNSAGCSSASAVAVHVAGEDSELTPFDVHRPDLLRENSRVLTRVPFDDAARNDELPDVDVVWLKGLMQSGAQRGFAGEGN